MEGVRMDEQGAEVGEGTMDDLRAQTHDTSLEDIFVHLVSAPRDEGYAWAVADGTQDALPS